MVPASIRGVVVRFMCVMFAGLLLSACDKCGNNIFRVDAGPLVCKGELPKS